MKRPQLTRDDWELVCFAAVLAFVAAILSGYWTGVLR